MRPVTRASPLPGPTASGVSSHSRRPRMLATATAACSSLSSCAIGRSLRLQVRLEQQRHAADEGFRWEELRNSLTSDGVVELGVAWRREEGAVRRDVVCKVKLLVPLDSEASGMRHSGATNVDHATAKALPEGLRPWDNDIWRSLRWR